MIRVYQDEFSKVGDENRKRGNCLAACVASILDSRIQDVPRFQDLPGDGSWYMIFQQFLSDNGFCHDIVDASENVEGYSIASGPSPRGPWSHACVYFNGKFLHDPHPEGNGLPKVNYHMVIRKK